MSLALNAGQIDSLLSYVALLAKWNKTFNLTAVREPEQMISRHLLDSLTTLPYVHGDRLVDIGSGAGLPGIPLAIARPDLHCLMLDSNSKKTRFIQQAIAELGLGNAEVMHARVESASCELASTLVSRAFSSPLDIISSAAHLCAADGVMLFMLGHPQGLLDNLPTPWRLAGIDAVTVPFEPAMRHIAVCRQP